MYFLNVHNIRARYADPDSPRKTNVLDGEEKQIWKSGRTAQVGKICPKILQASSTCDSLGRQTREKAEILLCSCAGEWPGEESGFLLQLFHGVYEYRRHRPLDSVNYLNEQTL